MSTKNQQIIKKIEDLEKQLKNLKLELQQEEPEPKFKIGDVVNILNPKRGQPSAGSIHKLHTRTSRATVITQLYNPRRQVKTIRLLKNLKKNNDDE